MWRLPKDDLITTQPTVSPGTPEYELLQRICETAASVYGLEPRPQEPPYRIVTSH